MVIVMILVYRTVALDRFPLAAPHTLISITYGEKAVLSISRGPVDSRTGGQPLNLERIQPLPDSPHRPFPRIPRDTRTEHPGYNHASGPAGSLCGFP